MAQVNETPAEYFNKLAGMIDELHKATHNPPMLYPPSRDLLVLVAGLADLLDYLSNTSSWSDRRLYNHDRTLMRREFDDKLAWRL